MITERTGEETCPVLLRYLRAADTRRAYLRKYKNIRVTRQRDKDYYYAFEADSRDGNGSLKADVFLHRNSSPIATRLIVTKTAHCTELTNIHVTNYDDMETVVQVKDLIQNYQVVPTFSVRRQLFRSQYGIQWVWDDEGPLKEVKVYPDPAVTIDISCIYGNSKNPHIQIEASDHLQGKYSVAVMPTKDTYLVEVNDSEGNLLKGVAPNTVDTKFHRLWLSLPISLWRDVAQLHPTEFLFSGPIKR
jgi:hypothetical protein